MHDFVKVMDVLAGALWIFAGCWALLGERDFQAGAIYLTCGNVFLLLARRDR